MSSLIFLFSFVRHESSLLFVICLSDLFVSTTFVKIKTLIGSKANRRLLCETRCYKKLLPPINPLKVLDSIIKSVRLQDHDRCEKVSM